MPQYKVINENQSLMYQQNPFQTFPQPNALPKLITPYDAVLLAFVRNFINKKTIAYELNAYNATIPASLHPYP